MAVVLWGSMAWVLVQHIRMITNTDAVNPETQLAQCSSQTSAILSLHNLQIPLLYDSSMN
jgi:hypothetical protein